MNGYGFNYSIHDEEKAIEKNLVSFAKKHPTEVIALNQGEFLQMIEVIKQAEESKVIKIDKAKKQIIWFQTKECIAVITPKIDPYTIRS